MERYTTSMNWKTRYCYNVKRISPLTQANFKFLLYHVLYLLVKSNSNEVRKSISPMKERKRNIVLEYNSIYHNVH